MSKLKRILILMLLSVFFVSVPAFTADLKIEIFGSIYGAMSDPGSWEEFSCIFSNGMLNKLKWQDYMEKFKAFGATSTRECPFLVHEDKTTITPNYMPFLFSEGKYDLDKFNPQYFENLAEMARIANGEGVIFYFSLFGPHGNWPTSPWVLNHQGIKGYYDQSPRADFYRRLWIVKILGTLKSPYVVGFEPGNEPHNENFPMIAAKIMIILRENKVPLNRIIMGAEFIRNDRIPGNKLYRQVKKAWKRLKMWDKRQIFSKVIHGAEIWVFRTFWHIQKHWSRGFISDDGCHPKKSAIYWYNVLKEWFEEVKLKKNKFFKTRSAFEHLYRYPQDDITGVYGIAKAVEDVYGIKMYTRAPMHSETVFSRAGYEKYVFSETADGFKIKKRKWYEIAWEILKAVYEILTDKR